MPQWQKRDIFSFNGEFDHNIHVLQHVCHVSDVDNCANTLGQSLGMEQNNNRGGLPQS